MKMKRIIKKSKDMSIHPPANQIYRNMIVLLVLVFSITMVSCDDLTDITYNDIQYSDGIVRTVLEKIDGDTATWTMYAVEPVNADRISRRLPRNDFYVSHEPIKKRFLWKHPTKIYSIKVTSVYVPELIRYDCTEWLWSNSDRTVTIVYMRCGMFHRRPYAFTNANWDTQLYLFSMEKDFTLLSLFDNDWEGVSNLEEYITPKRDRFSINYIK